MYWYQFEHHECPVCGRVKTFKERISNTRKPVTYVERHKYYIFYDHCLDRGY